MPEFKKGNLKDRRKLLEESSNSEQRINLEADIIMPEEQIEYMPVTPKKSEIGEKEVRGVGRPKKRGTLRNIPKTTKVDVQTDRTLQLLRIDYGFDMQDILFLAIQEYCANHFPGGKAQAEDLQKIKRLIAELNGNLM